MASNTKRQFKHPIQPTQSHTDILREIDGDEILEKIDAEYRVTQVPWNGMQILVRSYIGMDEMTELTDLVVGMIFVDGASYSELMDYFFRCAVLAFYTNIMMPSDEDSKFKIIYGTDLYETVKKYIHSGQIESMSSAIKMRIDR